MTDEKQPETQPWYRSVQFLTYGAGIITGVLTMLRSFGIQIFSSAALETLFAGGLVGTVSCVYALYRRFKAGNDPKNPTPKITLTEEKK